MSTNKKTAKILIAFFISLILPKFLIASQMIQVHSLSMNRNIPNLVTIPQTIKSAGNKKNPKFPVLYLLHGYSGDYRTWSEVLDIQSLAERCECIIVCPDGAYNSWYWNNPSDSINRYETYLAKELISYVDSNYATYGTKGKRAVAGFSMGGYGANYIALNHPELFTCTISIASIMDITEFSEQWDMADQLGPFPKNPELWNQHNLIEIFKGLKSINMTWIIICGREDFAYPGTLRAFEILKKRKIPHQRISLSAQHSYSDYGTTLYNTMDTLKTIFKR